MPKSIIIILVDNDVAFLKVRAELLEQEGYRVVTLSEWKKAQAFLREHWAHLHILDVRLENDEDEKDRRGLELAHDPFHAAIPKIMLTQFPASVLEWVNNFRGAHTPVGKDEPIGTFLEKVRAALGRLPVNWNMRVDWAGCDPFGLAHALDPEQDNARVENRREELEDLLRCLFKNYDTIRVDRELWRREGRVALVVYAFAGDERNAFVVVCGSRQKMQEERTAFRSAENAGMETRLGTAHTAELLQCGAHAYSLFGADLETVQTLEDFYRRVPHKIEEAAVQLVEKTLAPWHSQRVEQDHSPADDYRARLQLTGDRVAPERLQASLSRVMEQVREPQQMTLEGETLVIDLARKVLSYRHPLSPFWRGEFPGPDGAGVRTPGLLTADNILIESEKRSWLTDFGEAGRAPVFWDMTALEALLRFDLPRTNDLWDLYEMEEALTTGDEFSPDARHVNLKVLQYLVSAIGQVRRLARQMSEARWSGYRWGVYWHALKRLVDYDGSPRMPLEIARLAHVLMAMGIMAPLLLDGVPEEPAAGGTPDELKFAEGNHRVQIGTRLVMLSGESYKIFSYLHKRAGEFCTAEEVIAGAFVNRSANKQNLQKLYTDIRRLRQEIEVDPGNPRHLISSRGSGYMLVLKPSRDGGPA